MGLVEDVLNQVQASLVPPKDRMRVIGGKIPWRSTKAQLHILRQRVVKQKTAVVNAKDTYERSCEKLMQWRPGWPNWTSKVWELSVDPLTPSSSKVVSETLLMWREVQWNSADLVDLTGYFALPEPPDGVSQPGLDRYLPPAPHTTYVENEGCFQKMSGHCIFERCVGP